MEESKIIFRDVANTVTTPSRKHSTDAGIDLYASTGVSISPGNLGIIPTGVSVEIPENYFGFITNKSRNNFIVGAGIVDEGYRGELLIKVFNVLNEEIVISPGDAVAQLILVPTTYPKVVIGNHYHQPDETLRGSTGGIVSQYSAECLK